MAQCRQPMHLVSGSILKASFVDRPNRFLVRCQSDQLGRIEAFLPNPGRMHELLLPGSRLYLERCDSAGAEPNRKTAYTVHAVERDGHPICVNTHATNRVAHFLIERGRVPTLEGASVVGSEVKVGRSRFDLLIEQHGRIPQDATVFSHAPGFRLGCMIDRRRVATESIDACSIAPRTYLRRVA